ncbi:MAG TPA: hypothetical protein VE733_08300 [Streptosporangiaceae bacterium]|nr:hypothetical protein [Streptosporangiaceae bacterium]
MVTSSTTRDSAPLPTARAGLLSDCPKLTSLGAFFCTHAWT